MYLTSCCQWNLRMCQHFWVLWYLPRHPPSKWLSALQSRDLSFAQILIALLCLIPFSYCLSCTKRKDHSFELYRQNRGRVRSTLQPIYHLLFPTVHPKTLLTIIQLRQPTHLLYSLSPSSAQGIRLWFILFLYSLSFYHYLLKLNTEPIHREGKKQAACLTLARPSSPAAPYPANRTFFFDLHPIPALPLQPGLATAQPTSTAPRKESAPLKPSRKADVIREMLISLKQPTSELFFPEVIISQHYR